MAEEEFNASEFILDHIRDSHEWHLWTKADGHHVAVPLPVIVYSAEKGLNSFWSSHIAHGHEYRGFALGTGEYSGKIVEVDEHGTVTGLPLDFSMTKNVAGMLVASLIILILFIRMGRIYNRPKPTVPKGLNGFLEPMILFIRDEVAIPNIGQQKSERFMPYLLTAFFFILINNLMGLIPPVYTLWSQRYGQHCGYSGAGNHYLPYYPVQRQQKLLEAYFCHPGRSVLAGTGYDTG
jgi:F-type H+-transporting ATPase subunit a